VTFNNVLTATGCCQGQLLPNPNTPNNLIAAAWEDLYPPGGGTISYKTNGLAPNRLFTVTWNNVPHFAAGNKVFIQIQLMETSHEIRVMLQAMPSDGGLHTLGIENATGTVAIHQLDIIKRIGRQLTRLGLFSFVLLLLCLFVMTKVSVLGKMPHLVHQDSQMRVFNGTTLYQEEIYYLIMLYLQHPC